MSDMPQAARNDWRLDERGELDDVAVDAPAMFRLERMGAGEIWLAVYRRDGSRTSVTIRGSRLSMSYEHETV